MYLLPTQGYILSGVSGMVKAPEVVSLRAKGDGVEAEELQMGRFILRDDLIPTAKIETVATWKRRRAREKLYVPPTPVQELAPLARSKVSGRAMALWLIVHMQTTIEDQAWVRVPTHLREALGLSCRRAHSRAVLELEKAGYLKVRRRPGCAPLVRLVRQRAGDEVEDEDEGDADV
jgi:hypothetical protein